MQAKEEVDRLSQLTKDRSTLAFGSAMVRTISMNLIYLQVQKPALDT